jgi:hypothetical protein
VRRPVHRHLTLRAADAVLHGPRDRGGYAPRRCGGCASAAAAGRIRAAPPHMEKLTSFLAFGLLLAVPGLLLAYAVDARGRWLDALAAAPVLALGLIAVLARLTDVAGLPVGPLTVLLAVAIAAAAAVARRLQQRGAGSAEAAEANAATPADLEPAGLVPTGLVLLGCLVGVGVWASAVSGYSVPPNYDALHHGFITARIADTATLDPAQVLLSDVDGSDPIARYYPMGLHVPAAVAHEVVGVGVGRLLLAVTALFGGAVLPLGTYLLARTLVPDRPLVGGFAALVAPMLPLFPYKPIAWGGVALIVGLSTLPAAIALLWRAAAVPLRAGPVAGAALALAAVFTVHTSQVAMLLVALGGLAVAVLWNRPREGLRVVGRLTAAGGAGALILLPEVLAFVGGASERAAFDDTSAVPLVTALRPLLDLSVATPAGQPALVLTALAGVAVAVARRRHGGLLVGLSATVGLYLLAATSKGTVAQVLTLAWYRQAERVSYNLALFVAFFAGLALAELASWVRARVGRDQLGRWAPAGVALGALLVLGVVPLLGAQRMVRALFTTYSSVG